MNLFDFFIARPVFTIVGMLVIVLLGVVSYARLPLRQFPAVDQPIVSVETRYPGASAETMERQVTQVLEDSIASIDGIDTLTSESRTERSNITVRFVLEKGQDVAAADIRDRVTRVRNILPDEVDEPSIAKVEADADALMYLAFTSDRH
jgi:multidrug efflux pump